MKFLSVMITALLLVLVCQLADAMKRAGKAPLPPQATPTAEKNPGSRHSYNL